MINIRSCDHHDVTLQTYMHSWGVGLDGSENNYVHPLLADHMHHLNSWLSTVHTFLQCKD